MLKKIRFYLKKIILITFYRNKKIFYKDNFNSLDFLHLFLWNLAKPGRSISRIKHNRFMFPRKIKKDDNNFFVDAKNLSKNEIIEISGKKLKKYGTVILNEYFSESILSKFEN